MRTRIEPKAVAAILLGCALTLAWASTGRTSCRLPGGVLYKFADGTKVWCPDGGPCRSENIDEIIKMCEGNDIEEP